MSSLLSEDPASRSNEKQEEDPSDRQLPTSNVRLGDQTKLVTDELRLRGHVCEVLKLNENRRVKDPAYVDVQGGFDYLFKVLRYAVAGYRLNVHMNGQSKKGYILALVATLVGRLAFDPALITFHGGLSQAYFPRFDSFHFRAAFGLLFRLAGRIACDDDFVKEAITKYGIPVEKLEAIGTFSPQYLNFRLAHLSQDIDAFVNSRSSTFFCYVSFRPEYRLSTLREAMTRFREYEPNVGFIWVGFPAKEMPNVQEFVHDWPVAERRSLLLLGNLSHDEFLSLLGRCFACIRTPACDGVSASVLEALAMGIPVVASENGRRPQGTLTYAETDATDLHAKLLFLVENYSAIKASLQGLEQRDNIAHMADWLAGELSSRTKAEVAHGTQPS